VVVSTFITLTPAQKDRIVAQLKEKTAIKPCARCGNPNFNLLDFVFVNPIASPPPLQTFTGPTVPTVAVGCTRCGALYHHLLGILLPLAEFGLG
jgi:hypothetical protein